MTAPRTELDRITWAILLFWRPPVPSDKPKTARIDVRLNHEFDPEQEVKLPLTRQALSTLRHREKAAPVR
jgi:hypothetical protein